MYNVLLTVTSCLPLALSYIAAWPFNGSDVTESPSYDVTTMVSFIMRNAVDADNTYHLWNAALVLRPCRLAILVERRDQVFDTFFIFRFSIATWTFYNKWSIYESPFLVEVTLRSPLIICASSETNHVDRLALISLEFCMPLPGCNPWTTLRASHTYRLSATNMWVFTGFDRYTAF